MFLINIHRFRHPISTISISIQIKIPEARSTKYAITVSKVTPFGGSRGFSSSFGVQKFLSIRLKIPDLLMSWILCIKTKSYFTTTVRVFWKMKECILLDGSWCFGWTDWLHLQFLTVKIESVGVCRIFLWHIITGIYLQVCKVSQNRKAQSELYYRCVRLRLL